MTTVMGSPQIPRQRSKFGAIALFPGGLGQAKLRPSPFTAPRQPSMCSLSGEQPSRAARAASSESGDSEAGDRDARLASRSETAKSFKHVPVMVGEVVAIFANQAEGTVVDATLGGGGHAEALLDAYPQMNLVGLDRDGSAIAAASERLARFGSRFVAHRLCFDAISDVAGPMSVDGVLFDLGVSSPQLDRGERGFSHRNDGPLDMRMDDRDTLTAFDVVNTYSESALFAALRDNADEPHAGRIAKALVAARPVTTTGEMARLIAAVVPAAVRRKPRHPATRSFQAIRIEVNRELEVLEPALFGAVDALKTGGRLAVLAYHSGEDRLVKGFMRDESRTSPSQRPDLPLPPGVVTRLKLLWSGARKASPTELDVNPRSTSARLRAAERTEQRL